MTFTYPSLATIGALLALAPIVIHLLNRRRRKRVAWAAMDFLLSSHRKNRTWVRLSEWLLLAARVIAIAVVGTLAARPKTIDLLEGYFGADPATHLVLLDDTCSMQRREAGSSAWDEALAAVERLADAARDSGDRLVVYRYSDYLTGEKPSVLVGEGASSIDPKAWRPSNTAATPDAGLLRVLDTLDDPAYAGAAYAYVVSDFAEGSHSSDGDWAGPISRISDRTNGLVLAACGAPLAPNLAVESVSFAPGPIASGVETRLVVEVVNHASEPAPATPLAIKRNGRPLTALEAGPFEPGQRVRIETPVTFTGVGLHVVEASVPEDRLAADNRGWVGLEVPAYSPVLLVAGDPDDVEARVFAAALRPAGATRSGWGPERAAEIDPDTLEKAAAVALLDPPRLSRSSVERLREYVEAGGGLLLVLGPESDADWFNQSFASRAGAAREPMVPWRLGPAATATFGATEEATLRVADHPVVRALTGGADSFLPMVRVDTMRRLESDPGEVVYTEVSSAPADPSYDTLLRTADGAPLLVESRYGAGRVVALLTRAAPTTDGSAPWSNLASLPIFPILANDLVGWLSQELLRPHSELVGQTTGSAPPARSSLQRWSPDGPMAATDGLGPSALLSTATPGVYRRVLGGVEAPIFSARVDPAESELHAADVASLDRRWGGIARVGRAEQMFRDAPSASSSEPLFAAAAVLLCFLAVERVFAYRNSYVESAAGAAGRPA